MSLKSTLTDAFQTSDHVFKVYLADLDDAELLIHPVDGQHNIAWQLGHLLSSEAGMLNAIRPGSSPELPEDFDAGYGRGPEVASSEDNSRYKTKAEYLELSAKQRAATLSLLDSMSDDELDAEAPEPLKSMASSVASVFNLMAAHVLMHAGQFVSVRRKLQKPIAM